MSGRTVDFGNRKESFAYPDAPGGASDEGLDQLSRKALVLRLADGPGTEAKNAVALLELFDNWAQDLCPTMNVEDFFDKVEKMGKLAPVQAEVTTHLGERALARKKKRGQKAQKQAVHPEGTENIAPGAEPIAPASGPSQEAPAEASPAQPAAPEAQPAEELRSSEPEVRPAVAEGGMDSMDVDVPTLGTASLREPILSPDPE